MDIQIPAVPAGVLTLLSLFAPYAVAAINGVLSFVQEPWQKKTVSIAVAVLLAGVVLGVYIAATGDVPTSWWAFFLLGVVVVAASYALVTKPSATVVERAASPSELPADIQARFDAADEYRKTLTDQVDADDV